MPNRIHLYVVFLCLKFKLLVIFLNDLCLRCFEVQRQICRQKLNDVQLMETKTHKCNIATNEDMMNTGVERKLRLNCPSHFRFHLSWMGSVRVGERNELFNLSETVRKHDNLKNKNIDVALKVRTKHLILYATS